MRTSAKAEVTPPSGGLPAGQRPGSLLPSGGRSLNLDALSRGPRVPSGGDLYWDCPGSCVTTTTQLMCVRPGSKVSVPVGSDAAPEGQTSERSCA